MPKKSLFEVVSAIFYGNGNNNNFYGTAANDTIYGYDGNDILHGGYGNDAIYGGTGNDTLYSDFGIDTLYGGSGNDVYYVDNDDIIIEKINEGTDNVYASTSYTLQANVENLILTGNSTPIIRPDGISIYGNPLGWKNLLDHSQGDNSYNYWSDCGIVACENMLIQSGLMSDKEQTYNSQSLNTSTFRFVQGNTDENETALVTYAKNNDFCDESNADPRDNGGTSVLDQIAILSGNGVASHYEFLTLETLANHVKNNRSVIAEIDANVIWNGTSSGGINHAVVITGVTCTPTGAINGFYICDSGTMGIPGYVRDVDRNGIYNDDAAKFVSYNTMKNAFYYYTNGRSLLGLSVVTDNSVKGFLDKINATGNELANVITGNAGANLIKGMNGSDVLYGKGGNDTLTGGTGNDALYGGFGNDRYEFVVGNGVDTISDDKGVSDSVKFNVANNLINFSWTQNDLIVNYGNNGDKVTILGQNSVEYFYANDNSFITFDSLNATIQQMSMFNNESGTILPNINDSKITQDITPYLASSWQHIA